MVLFDGRKNMLKGNLHTHTTCSDGKLTPEQSAALYKGMGFDFVAFTDHRKVCCAGRTEDGFTVLSGAEFDFNLPAQVIHIVGIGLPLNFADDYRAERGAQSIIDKINAAGGVPIFAHPSWSLNTPAIMAAMRNVDIAEIYNTFSGSPWNGDRADSSVLLDECACAGKRYRFVASDDSHWYAGEAGKSYTVVAAEENSEAAIVAALKAGEFYASQGPTVELLEREGNTLRVKCSPVNRVWFSSNLPWSAKRCVNGEGITEATYEMLPQNGEHFVRVTVEDKDGRRAWLNSIEV